MSAQPTQPNATPPPQTRPSAKPCDPAFLSWVQSASKGDREAFSHLVRELQEPLYRVVYRYVRHSPDARDIVQRTFLKAWTHLATLQQPESFRSWIFSIAVNFARNQLRTQTSRSYEPVEDARLSVPPEAHASLSKQQELSRLRQALQHLPDRQRQVVTLRIDAELSFRDIAQSLGCSEGSARVNFHHGLKRLRELLHTPTSSGGQP